MEQGPSLFEALGCSMSRARCRWGRNFPREAGSCVQGRGRRAGRGEIFDERPQML